MAAHHQLADGEWLRNIRQIRSAQRKKEPAVLIGLARPRWNSFRESLPFERADLLGRPERAASFQLRGDDSGVWVSSCFEPGFFSCDSSKFGDSTKESGISSQVTGFVVKRSAGRVTGRSDQVLETMSNLMGESFKEGSSGFWVWLL